MLMFIAEAKYLKPVNMTKGENMLRFINQSINRGLCIIPFLCTSCLTSSDSEDLLPENVIEVWLLFFNPCPTSHPRLFLCVKAAVFGAVVVGWRCRFGGRADTALPLRLCLTKLEPSPSLWSPSLPTCQMKLIIVLLREDIQGVWRVTDTHRMHNNYQFLFQIRVVEQMCNQFPEMLSRPKSLPDFQTIGHPLTLIGAQDNLKSTVCNFSHLTCSVPLGFVSAVPPRNYWSAGSEVQFKPSAMPSLPCVLRPSWSGSCPSLYFAKCVLLKLRSICIIYFI